MNVLEKVGFNEDFLTQDYGGGQIYNLPVDAIKPNPFQPRRHFEPMALVDLATSIKQYGLMQPINVRINQEGEYELVSGERRLRASKLADIATIPTLIVSITDAESAILAMVENLQRQNLNYIEEAEGFSQLLIQHNLTQDELAHKMGKNQSTIANKLRLLKLPASVKRLLIIKDLSERHARAMLRLQKELDEAEAEAAMLEIIGLIEKEGLTVQRTEELIERILRPKTKKNAVKHNIKSYVRDMRIFTNTIKHAVGVMKDSGVNAEYDVDEREDGCIITVMVTY
ncbi:MAG: ParB/RepB/Spo0J family partition protein [Defluviitaleaceae bacterium]|nr:ParB/RepB/Spo0J family partition protein [Defluviitaleaceae bacterium]